MMLKKYFYRMLMAVWLLSGGVSFSAYAFGQAARFESWSSTQSSSGDMPPAYRFKSTSAYSPVLGESPYSSEIFSPLAKSPTPRPNRVGGPWDDDDYENDNPTGVVDDPLPVGEPLVLLVMASLYFLFIVIRRRRTVG